MSGIHLSATLEQGRPILRAEDEIEVRTVTSIEELVAFVRDRTSSLTDAQHESVGKFAAALVVVQEGAQSKEEIAQLDKLLDSWHFPCRDTHATQRLTRGQGEALFTLSRADALETAIEQIVGGVGEGHR